MNLIIKNLLILNAFACCTQIIFAQNLTKLKSAKEVVWCGIDFSHVKCIGAAGFTDPSAIAREYFIKWNDLIILEPAKFPVSKACGNKSIKLKPEIAGTRNLNIDAENLVTNDDYHIDEAIVKSIINAYPKIEGADVAFVLVAESLNKISEQGFMYAVFFDTSNNEIIWMKYFSGIASGFGFRNYWATPIMKVLDATAKEFKQL